MRNRLQRAGVIAAGIVGAGLATGQEAAVPFPGPAPGNARAAVRDGALEIGNDLLTMRYTVRDGHVLRDGLTHRGTGQRLELPGELFRLELEDGRVLLGSSFELVGAPQALSVTPAGGPRVADRVGGKELRCDLRSPDGRIGVVWSARLLDGGNGLREGLEVSAPGGPLALARIVTLEGPLEDCARIGSVQGSVLADGDVLFAVEHPMAANEVRFPTTVIGGWNPEHVSSPEASLHALDVTDAVAGDGPVRVRFQYTAGGQRLDVFWVALLADGHEVSRDEHHGHTGDVDVDNEYDLVVDGFAEGTRYTLVASTSADGGTDSTGIVTWSDRSAVPTAHASLDVVPLEAGESVALRTLFCAVAPGQTRRSFLHDLERNRAHPYRPFLQYNTWYDLGFFTDYDEADALAVVRAYGEHLVRERGVQFDSFLFDDGWDDHRSLWNFHDGFPDGFRKIGELARSFGAGPGVWLSPWGGYGEPRKERLEAGKAAGYETNAQGFALSAPKYFERIEEVCLGMIRDYGVNLFKFDGIGRKGGRFPGSRFPSDFAAAIQLIRDLRAAEPDVFINLTTGTWPSPFWLEYADSIWRGGYDHSFLGVGTPRQQWMTYRDAQTYSNVVRGGPLYPINSLMVHGVIYAPHANKLDTDPEGDLRAELRTAFGMGTQLQELYVSPGLLTDANWDDLAAAAKWSRALADTLVDVHWVGGDPAAGESYGWAAWRPGSATLTLRNPSDRPSTFSFDPARDLELPPRAALAWLFESPFADQRPAAFEADAGSVVALELAPFEVLVFQGRPRGEAR